MRNPQTFLSVTSLALMWACVFAWAFVPDRSFGVVEAPATLAVLANPPARYSGFPAPDLAVSFHPLQPTEAPIPTAQPSGGRGPVTFKGKLTWYGLRHPNGQLYHGRYTKSGRKFSQNELTCAVPPLHKGSDKPIVPYGTKLKFTIPNGKSVVCEATDLCRGGTWDQSTAGMKALGFKSLRQKVDVVVEVLP